MKHSFHHCQKEPYFKFSECEKLVDEAMRYHVLADQRPLMQSPRTQPRKTCSKRRLKVIKIKIIINLLITIRYKLIDYL